MARISKAEHANILRMVDVEDRKIAAVATEYGCTPANIYALLSKLRRASGEARQPDRRAAGQAGHTETTEVTARMAAPADLLSVMTGSAGDAALSRTGPEISRRTPEFSVSPTPPIATSEPSPLPPVPGKGAAKAKGVGGALAKPGFGLMMRTEDGEENLTPFRSLDDLLSAVKPILRTAARSADPVWFSIQPVDLATLDSDAI